MSATHIDDCGYTWCESRTNGHDEHWQDCYVLASRSGKHRPGVTVGAGVMTIDGDLEGPQIFVHIKGPGQTDEDAYMTIGEATDLVDALVTAIGHAHKIPIATCDAGCRTA